MTKKRRSPLDPGAYGKPQRWHEILTEGAETRTAKQEEARRRNAEAAESAALLVTIVPIISN
jgi:hypothetical protein